MDMSNFVTIGENVHCTLVVKKGGIHTVELPGDALGIKFNFKGQDRVMVIPDNWADFSPGYAQGSLKHIALAVWYALNTTGDDQQTGMDYIANAAQRQIDNAATFLDVNVDEYTNDHALRIDVMKWMATFLSERFETPLSIDSSNKEILDAGLSCCRKDIGVPMLNSVSLEREDSVELIQKYNAEVVVGATGREDMPTTLEGRMTNVTEIIGKLDALGIERNRMHIDPLVYPISTDPNNGKGLFDAVTAIRKTFDGVHITGGFSNISFGMPQRKLLTMVFVNLCVQAGADSGIINPVHMSAKAIGDMDQESVPFKLAAAVLTGEDMYGMEFITAHREGKLK
ncbi:MAG: dihydropteroate synthase [Phycisphaerae bacterium]|nr:dihydropteroate synthase [Phycisphaerae bacterium]